MDSDKSTTTVSKCMYTGCKKKIGVLERITGICNCGKTFCVSHKSDTMHGCTFDYKTRDLTTLASTLTKVVAEKVTTI